MRPMNLVLVLALLVGGASVASAECPKGLKLKKVGTVANATEAIATAGVDVRAIGWQCTSSACTFGLYDTDGDTPSEVGEGGVVFESGDVASGGDFLELSQPLTFADGVYVAGSNLTGVIVYACAQ